MEELKPCPFCGDVAKLNAPGYEYYSPYWCKCTRCGAEGPTKSSELEAEKGWNERVQDDVENASIIDNRMHDMDIETVDGRGSRSMNDYLECIVKFQYGIEVGYREELVRCKYCIKRKTNGCLMYWNGIFDDETQDDDWYCPDGERSDA